ncbi:MAG TPA: hypothetical protein VD931_21710 [Baekduia sp.]|nr:hypothetical protein [Baekduia sp.]
MRGTDCGPLLRDEGVVPDDRVLVRRIGRYDCVAVRRAIVKRGKVVGTLGHAFVAALDFRDFSYVWCRNLPPPGERAEALAVVPLQPACLATGGARLGTGYADTSGR